MTEIDKSTMPPEIKGDVMRESHWLNEEKNRLSALEREKEQGNNEPPPAQETDEEKAARLAIEKETIKVQEFDLSEFSEFEVKSKDEIKERLKEHVLTKKERDDFKRQFEEKNNEYQQFIEKSKANPFTDPDLYRLNQIKRESPADYDFYKKIVMGGADGIELLKEQYLKENPSEKPEIIEMYIKNKYGLDKEYDVDIPDEAKAKQLNEFAFRQDVKKIKDGILAKFNEITLPEPTIIDEEKVKQENAIKLAQHRTDLKKSWSPYAEKIVEAFDKMPIYVAGEGEEKEKEFMDYIIPKETKKELATQVLKYLVDNNKPLTEDSVSEAQVQVRWLYDLQNRAAINTAFGDRVRAINDEEWQKIRVNPSALQSKSNTEKEKGKTDAQKRSDLQKEVFNKGMGIK